jgi:hypothetical protein
MSIGLCWGLDDDGGRTGLGQQPGLMLTGKRFVESQCLGTENWSITDIPTPVLI